jgi:hypothetical protein
MSNEFERARDLRQLRFMLSTIRSYESGASTFPRLVEDLDELLRSLSDEDEAWREQFEAAWSVLEERYTVVLERGESDVDETSATMTQHAVTRLADLVSAEIQRRERGPQGG